MTIGATDNTTGYLGAKSVAYALNGNGTWKFNFTNYNAGNGGGYNNFILNANDGKEDKFCLRADQFEVVAWSNANITRPGYTWTDEATFVTDMNGADVDMTVSRVGNVVYVNSTITPSSGTAFKYNYVYTAATGNLNLYLSVDNSHLVLHEAKEYTSVYAADFENAETYTSGWTGSGRSQLTYNGSKYMHMYNGGYSTTTFSSLVSNSDDYIMEFDWNVGQGNGSSRGGTALYVSTTDGNIFIADKKNAGWSSAYTFADGNGTNLLGTDTYRNGAGYIKEAAFASMCHVILKGNETEGTVLTITEGNEIVVNEVQLSASCLPICGLGVYSTNNAGCAGIDNVIISAYSDNEIVPDPSASITGVNGAARTVTLSLGDGSTDGSKLYYSDNSDGSSATLYSAPVEVTESKTLYFYTLSAKGNKSAIQSIDVDCSALTLVAPTYAKGAYTAGVTTVTLNANESSVLLNPTATIHYSTSAGAQGDIANGASIDVADGVTVTAYAKAAGYTNSANFVFTAVAPCNYTTIVNEIYNGRVSSNCGFALGAEKISGYSTLTYNDGEVKTVSENLLVEQLKGGANDLMRPNGVYFAGGTNVAVPNVKAGDVITFNGVWGNGAYFVSATNNVVKDEWNSNEGAKYVFTVTADGNAYFNIARYGYTQSMTIQSDVEVATMAVNAEAKYGTFCAPFAVAVPSGVTAHTATLDGTTIVLTSVAENTIPANTPVILYAESGLDATTFYGKAVNGTPTAGVLTGVYTSTPAVDGWYVLQNNDEGVGFYQVDTKVATPTVGANRAYLTVSAGANVRAFRLDNNANAIEAISAIANNAIEAIYNANGVKVNALQKGINVVKMQNGKTQKVLVK